MLYRIGLFIFVFYSVLVVLLMHGICNLGGLCIPIYLVSLLFAVGHSIKSQFQYITLYLLSTLTVVNVKG